MDELSLWNKARSQYEIKNAMNLVFSGPQSGLVLYYNFNQGKTTSANTLDTTLLDESDTYTFGTLHNFALTGTASNLIMPGATKGFSRPSKSYIRPLVGAANVCQDSVLSFVALPTIKGIQWHYQRSKIVFLSMEKLIASFPAHLTTVTPFAL